MAGVLQHLRSSTLDKRPNPASMVDGQVAINYASGAPGMFFKDSNGSLVKVGPVHVGTTAPNVSPASGGTAGNSRGEQWLDTTGGTYVFKIWDGSAWRSESGTFVDTSGDTMTGALGIIAGSASTPGLFFSGDTNTGIYSPGADQVAISTSGAQRLVVDASGRVGIGVSGGSLSQPLHVRTDQAAYTWARVDNQSSSASAYSGLQVGAFGNSWGMAVGSSAANSNALAFVVDAGGTNTERLRITAAGLVGVGVSEPADALHLASGNFRLTNGAAFTSGNSTIRSISSYAGSANQFETTRISSITGAFVNRGELTFSTGDDTNTCVERLRIDYLGRVGIGVSAPTEALTVNGRVQSQWNAFVNGGSTSYSGDATSLVTGSTAGMWAARSDSALLFSIGSSEKVRIDSSGRVAIGATSPNALLDVRSATTWIGDGTTDAFLQFNQSATAANRWHIGTGSGNALIFYKGTYGSGSETARIDSSGRLLVGTSTLPSTGAGIGIEKVDGNIGRITIGKTATGNTDGIPFFYDGTYVGGITYSNTAVTYVTSSDYRLKQNVTAVTNGITRLQQLNPSRFNFIADPATTVDGFLAHEVQAVVPEAVTGEKDAVDDDDNPVYQGIDQSKLVPLLTAALQEAVAKIESLEARLTAAGI